jgi:hypothetical protein
MSKLIGWTAVDQAVKTERINSLFGIPCGDDLCVQVLDRKSEITIDKN